MSFCVWQQFGVIKDNTDLKVEQYYGDKGVDQWDLASWNKEVRENDVSVLFPLSAYNICGSPKCLAFPGLPNWQAWCLCSTWE